MYMSMMYTRPTCIAMPAPPMHDHGHITHKIFTEPRKHMLIAIAIGLGLPLRRPMPPSLNPWTASKATFSCVEVILHVQNFNHVNCHVPNISVNQSCTSVQQKVDQTHLEY